MKKILILTAGFGEGHNSAARGIRDGLRKISPEGAHVELHDLFAETYGFGNDWARVLYMGMINRTPRVWRVIYRWLDRQEKFAGDFRVFVALKNYLHRMLARLQPDVIVSVYPAYPHMLDELLGWEGAPQHKRVVVITDSISVNAIWYRCSADYFLLPNAVSAEVLLEAGIPAEKVKPFGFPVSPIFAQPGKCGCRRPMKRVGACFTLSMRRTPAHPRWFGGLPAFRNPTHRHRRSQCGIESLRRKIRRTVTQEFETVDWSDELPRLLRANHLVISKAGGATVQEAMSAACPMIVNHVIPGQEEGNARFIMETKSGTVALSHDAVIAAVQNAFANDAAQWREWSTNISQLGRPTASLDIARFLLSI